jgi:uncharacterized membrane protein
VLPWVAWNIFLAVIPVGLGYAIRRLACGRGNVPAMVLLGIAWLLFLPNACYLLTEWRHFLDTVESVRLYTQWQHGGNSTAMLRLMIYTLFYTIFSGVGMLAFALAIRPVAQVLRAKEISTWLWAIPLFFLNALGVYLGLILRFNSWDVLGRLADIWHAAAGALTRPFTLATILAFAVFLWLAYLALDIWIEGYLYLRRTRTTKTITPGVIPER